MHALLALTLASMGTGGAHEPPPLYLHVSPHNGNLYAVSPEPMSWTEAREWARSYGGELALIRNEAENEWVFETFAGSREQPRNLWIGLSDTHEEGVFRWNRRDAVGFSAWSPHEPNNRRQEHFAHIWNAGDRYPGRWNDYRDSADGPHGVPMHGVLEIVPRR